MEIQKKKSRNRAVIIGVTVLLCLTAAGIFALAADSDGRKLAHQLELGQKYLDEMDYEQAIVAYEAAIAIDPKCVDAYLALAEAYIGLGDYDSAVAVLEEGYENTESEEILRMLNEYKNGGESAGTVAVEDEAADTNEVKEVYPLISDLNIPFTVDEIVLGETGIEAAKSAYGNRPFALSNLMNEEQDDTVYTCYGMNDMPIPEGYKEMAFGFLFVEPVGGGGINEIVIQDPDFTCVGGLHVRDSGDTALEYFGLQELASLEDADLEWTLDNGAVLSCCKESKEDYFIYYELGNKGVMVRVINSMIHGFILTQTQ